MISIQHIRRLCDLAKILENVHKEAWHDAVERKAVINGLQTWPPVLREIVQSLRANLISEIDAETYLMTISSRAKYAAKRPYIESDIGTDNLQKLLALKLVKVERCRDQEEIFVSDAGEAWLKERRHNPRAPLPELASDTKTSSASRAVSVK